MPRDFLTLAGRPADLVKALKKILLGGVITAAGVAPAAAGEPSSSATAPTNTTPTIVDRWKKSAKLVLQLPGHSAYVSTEHRSHRSHSSHRSHYSSAGGGGTARPPATPAPAPNTLNTPLSANTVRGEIESVDTIKRILVIRETDPTKPEALHKTFAYRDDTKYEVSVGALGVRFDDYSAANQGRLPVSVGSKVQVKWRISPDGKTSIATNIQKMQ